MNNIKSGLICFLRLLRVRRPAPVTYLIPAYAGLGNFIMATPMILALRRLHPAARIVLLTWPKYGTDEVFSCPTRLEFGRLGNLATLKHGGDIVDAILLLNPQAGAVEKARFFFGLRGHITHALMLFDAVPSFVWWGVALAGIPRVLGHDVAPMGIEMGWTRLVMDRSVPVNVGSHETDIHFDLLDLLEGRKVERSYATHVADAGLMALERFGLRPGKYVVVQISAANALIRTPKLWERSRWAAVIRELEARGETVVLPGDRNEQPVLEAFVREYGLHRAVNIAGQTTVAEVSAIIKYAKLLLVHDSGLMHIGNAHGTPLIALYGPTDWNFTAPKAPTSRILRKNLPCQPCMARMAKTEQEALRDCKVNVQCMRDITVEDVLAAVREESAVKSQKADL